MHAACSLSSRTPSALSSLFDNLIGKTVGAGRWPYAASHPDGWGDPWTGVVLAQDDPRAWAGTIAFPEASPDPEAVSRHVNRLREEGLLQDRVPVLWSFGKVHWERPEVLVSADADRHNWEMARAEAYRLYSEAERKQH